MGDKDYDGSFKYEYDEQGRLKVRYEVQISDGDWNNPETLEFELHTPCSCEYDEHGNLVKVTKEGSYSNINNYYDFEYEYDEHGNIIVQYVHVSHGDTSNAEPYTVKMEYEYDDQGRRTVERQYRSDDQLVLEIEYDDQGRKIVEYSKSEECKYEYEYDDQGALITKLEHMYEFDVNHNMDMIEAYIFATKYEYEYDKYGNKTAQYETEEDEDGHLLSRKKYFIFENEYY